MDPAWLSIVKERSQFLFLRLWSFRDWEINARPFLYLAFISFATKTIACAESAWPLLIVGAAGLAVGLIADAVGPVAILVQGQAWRWVWIAVFVCSLLLPATILQIWPDKKCGPLCAVLLILGLTLPHANRDGLCIVVPAFVVPMRAHFSLRAVLDPYTGVLRRCLAALVGWISLKSGKLFDRQFTTSGSGNCRAARYSSAEVTCGAGCIAHLVEAAETARAFGVPSNVVRRLTYPVAVILPGGV